MLGGYEWIIVLVAVVLLFFGAKKIPEFVRSLGMAVSEFKRGRMMVEKEIEEEMMSSSTKPVKKVRTKNVKKVDPETVRIGLVKKARALDIETKGKSNAQIRKEIDEALA